jgi:hypothetical protein
MLLAHRRLRAAEQRWDRTYDRLVEIEQND